MVDIAVFHPYLDTRGGGEAISMRIIESLQHEHDLTVYSLNKPDLDALNRQFNTAVEHVQFESLGVRGAAVRRGGEVIYRLMKQPTRRLQAALTYSYIDRQDHDLIFSTYNEFGFSSPSIQHIDYPNFGPEFESEPESLIERVYGTVCNVAHRGTTEQIRNAKLLADSEWTADIVEDVYDIRPQVVYPPVDTSGFDPQPWAERENGFVSVGRADPVKRPLKVMDIFEQVAADGYDVHLHWLGDVDDTAYGRKVRQRADEIEAVTLEGKVPFSEVSRMLSTHKYGLHGRVNEHFGIAVAEMLAGGAIPFIHASGGQQEIVNYRDELLYQEKSDAVRKIETVLEMSGGQEIIRALPDVESKFGINRFRTEIQEAVAETQRS